jgi:peptidoglycan hydrolase CwlO-like protein
MPKRKIVNEEPEEEKYEWDKPRVIIFFSIVAILLIGVLLAKHFLLDVQTVPTQKSVQGISTSRDTSLPTVQSVQQGVTEQLSHLQQQATQIDVQEIASSSPQVQQILQEIKQLPSAPGNIAKQTCLNICNSL